MKWGRQGRVGRSRKEGLLGRLESAVRRKDGDLSLDEWGSETLRSH